MICFNKDCKFDLSKKMSPKDLKIWKDETKCPRCGCGSFVPEKKEIPEGAKVYVNGEAINEA